MGFQGLTKVAGKLGLALKQKSPEILVCTAIIAGGAAIIMACRATYKLDKVIKPANEKREELKRKLDQDSNVDVKAVKKEIRILNLKTTGKLIRLYAPSGILFGTAVAAVLGSHKIMKGRQVALAAAYATLDSSYKDYRDRVKRRFGEDVEDQIYKDIYKETKVTSTVDANGNVTETEQTVKLSHMNPSNEWGVWFDESNANWQKNGVANLEWLLGIQHMLNQRLQTRGYVMLEEVYRALGIEAGILGSRKLQASRVLGWIYDTTDKTRDNWISFGLVNAEGIMLPAAMDMRRGERNCFIDLNPDGDIVTGNNGNKTFMKYAKW